MEKESNILVELVEKVANQWNLLGKKHSASLRQCIEALNNLTFQQIAEIGNPLAISLVLLNDCFNNEEGSLNKLALLQQANELLDQFLKDLTKENIDNLLELAPNISVIFQQKELETEKKVFINAPGPKFFNPNNNNSKEEVVEQTLDEIPILLKKMFGSAFCQVEKDYWGVVNHLSNEYLSSLTANGISFKQAGNSLIIHDAPDLEEKIRVLSAALSFSF